jgi:hypothetical protein
MAPLVAPSAVLGGVSQRQAAECSQCHNACLQAERASSEHTGREVSGSDGQ